MWREDNVEYFDYSSLDHDTWTAVDVADLDYDCDLVTM